MSARIWIWIAAVSCLGLSACSEEGTPTEDAGVVADGGVVLDATARPDATADAGAGDSESVDTSNTDASGLDAESAPDATDPSVPILERTPRMDRSCALTSRIHGYGGATWQVEQLLATTSSTVWLLSSEWVSLGRSLSLTQVDLQGELGPSTPLIDDGAGEASMIELDAGQLAIAWRRVLDFEDEVIEVAIAESSGQLLSAPVRLDTTRNDRAWRPRLLRTENGLALFWVGGEASLSNKLQMLRLDSTGEPTGTPVELAMGGSSWDAMQPSVTIDSLGRFAVVFARAHAGASSEVFYEAVDASGSTLLAERRISREGVDGWSSGSSSGFGRGGTAIVEKDGSIVAAWTESFDNATHDQGFTTIVLARIDDAGDVELHPLQSPVLDRENVEPVLQPFADRLLLSWSTGTRIYICAGCFPDNGFRAVLLDASDLVPTSNVLELPPDGGGLLGHTLAPMGANILVAVNQTYHVYSEPGTFGMVCD